MKMKAVTICGPSGSKRTVESISATARLLSGNGTTSNAVRLKIARRINAGGGYVGNVHVASA